LARVNILPQDRVLAEQVIASRVRQEERVTEMGRFGIIFGSVQEKPGNIAGMVILSSFIVLVAILIISAENSNFKTDALIPVFTGIISLALGYLFGKSTT
jgi:hypothetical protein